MSYIIDEKDQKILDVVKNNAKLSTQHISKKTLIPITTVHHRIKKLEKEGIIIGYRAVVNPKKLGKGIGAYILITVDYNNLKELKMTQHDLATKISKKDDVEEVSMVTGGTDILIKVRASDIDSLDALVTKNLRTIGGIEKTQTMIILHEF